MTAACAGFLFFPPPGAKPINETTDIETVIQDLLTGQYGNPIRVVAFNTAERWSEDVFEGVAGELRRRCDLQARELPPRSLILSKGARDPIGVNWLVSFRLAFCSRLPIYPACASGIFGGFDRVIPLTGWNFTRSTRL
jgi:hypothetical protein